MNSVRLQTFATCENFHNLGNPQAQFVPPKLNTCNKTKKKLLELKLEK